MRLALFLLRLLFRTLRLLVGIALAVIRCLTLVLLWMLAPRACLAVWVLRR